MVKMLLVVMSGDEEKLKMPLTFAKKQTETGNEVRVVLWGPSERAVANSEALQESYSALGAIKPKACINIAKAQGVDEKLSRNFELLPVNAYIAKSIEEGYAVITF
ncbi:MAG: hypothetical protein ACP5UH_01525 [Candidatus Micrarchaeia archaeon]